MTQLYFEFSSCNMIVFTCALCTHTHSECANIWILLRHASTRTLYIVRKTSTEEKQKNALAHAISWKCTILTANFFCVCYNTICTTVISVAFAVHCITHKAILLDLLKIRQQGRVSWVIYILFQLLNSCCNPHCKLHIHFTN